MFIAFFLMNFCFAQPPITSLKNLPKENCFIETSTKYKTGETKTDSHPYRMKSKAACEKSRKAHMVNFDPGMVEKIESKMVWQGGK